MLSNLELHTNALPNAAMRRKTTVETQSKTLKRSVDPDKNRYHL